MSAIESWMVSLVHVLLVQEPGSKLLLSMTGHSSVIHTSMIKSSTIILSNLIPWLMIMSTILMMHLSCWDVLHMRLTMMNILLEMMSLMLIIRLIMMNHLLTMMATMTPSIFTMFDPAHPIQLLALNWVLNWYLLTLHFFILFLSF